MRRRVCLLILSVCCATLSSELHAAIFVDDMNTAASSGNYVLQSSSADNLVTFGFDYSSLGIAAAPNTTDGSTFGTKMEANRSLGVAAGVTLHTNQLFTGAYRVRFDAWINANGPFPGGGAGSTEFLTAGVGGNGTAVNLGATGSGGWVAVSGEGGSARDYRMYKDTGEQFAESGQFAAGLSSSGGGAHNSADPYYAQFGNIDVGTLPVQGGMGNQTGVVQAGAFGFAWHQVELTVDPAGLGTVEWKIDGLRIGTLDGNIGPDFATDGRVTIGYMDIFASLSNAPAFSFGLVDNLEVSAVPEPSSFAFGAIAIAAALVRTRRRKV